MKGIKATNELVEQAVLDNLLNKGYASVKVGNMDLIVLTVPFAKTIGFKEGK